MRRQRRRQEMEQGAIREVRRRPAPKSAGGPTWIGTAARMRKRPGAEEIVGRVSPTHVRLRSTETGFTSPRHARPQLAEIEADADGKICATTSAALAHRQGRPADGGHSNISSDAGHAVVAGYRTPGYSCETRDRPAGTRRITPTDALWPVRSSRRPSGNPADVHFTYGPAAPSRPISNASPDPYQFL